MCRPNRDQFYTYKISDSFCICSIRAECGKMALLNSSCHWVSGLRRTCSFQSVSQSVSNLVSHHQLPPRHPTSTWVLPYLKSSSILHNAVVQNIIDQVDKVQLRVAFQPEAAWSMVTRTWRTCWAPPAWSLWYCAQPPLSAPGPSGSDAGLSTRQPG